MFKHLNVLCWSQFAKLKTMQGDHLYSIKLKVVFWYFKSSVHVYYAIHEFGFDYIHHFYFAQHKINVVCLCKVYLFHEVKLAKFIVAIIGELLMFSPSTTTRSYNDAVEKSSSSKRITQFGTVHNLL